ncbi:hypothetical protein GCM10009000_029590 [Halobacterium noricense]
MLRRGATGELSTEIELLSDGSITERATGSRSTMAQTLPVDELLVNKVRATTRNIMQATGFECVRQERDVEEWRRE